MSNSLHLPSSSLDNTRKTVVLEQRVTGTGAVQNQPPLVQVQVTQVQQPQMQVLQSQQIHVQPQVVQQYQVQSQVQQLHQVQPQIQVQPQMQVQQVETPPQPERPKSPEKKLSPAEIQRRKINAASEYFKKLRENAAANAGAGAPEKSDAKSVPSKQVPMTLGPDGRSVPAGSAPLGPPPGSSTLGPPPPLIPTTFAAQKSMPELVVTTNSDNSTTVAFTTTSTQQQTFNQQNYAQLTLDGSTNQTIRPTLVGQTVQMQTSPTSPAKPNIDLGAIVRSTIINGVTKVFTQVK